MTAEQWRAEATARFGPEPLGWKFRCPSCGNVQSLADFQALRMTLSEAIRHAYFSCIGRYDGHGDVDMCSGKSPCNYTLGGLFPLEHVVVIDESGNERLAFPFAEAAEGDATQ